MKLSERMRSSSERNYERKACEIYQVMEHEGELWLTYCGGLICPCSMLKDDAVKSLQTMRKLFVARHARG